MFHPGGVGEGSDDKSDSLSPRLTLPQHEMGAGWSGWGDGWMVVGTSVGTVTFLVGAAVGTAIFCCRNCETV